MKYAFKLTIEGVEVNGGSDRSLKVPKMDIDSSGEMTPEEFKDNLDNILAVIKTFK